MILLNFIGAFEAEDLPRAEKMVAMAGHKAMGISILVLSVLRLVWKLIHPSPPLVETLKSWEAALAKVTHWLFYFLMIATPLAGWSLHSAASGGKALTWFGQFDIPALPVGADKPTVGMFHELHEMFAFAMLLLLVLHVAAALKHQFVDRDGTLRRITPFMK
jgi:cytochrome b561